MSQHLIERINRLKNGVEPEPDSGKLLPIRNQQTDFFVADLTDYAIKDDRTTMEAPIFSLSTKKDTKNWHWVSADGKKSVHVTPHPEYGRATQFDKDILIYCTSQLIAAKNAGRKISRTVRFVAYDFLKATNRNTRGDDYTRLIEALHRLRNTAIMTEVKKERGRTAKGFGIIDEWEIVEKSLDDGRMVAVSIELSKWLFDSIQNQEVLTINRNYFRLRKPLERRLYEIARKHVGKQATWEIGIEAFRDKCGSTVSRIRKFKEDLLNIIGENTLPDYNFEVLENGKVRFFPR